MASPHDQLMSSGGADVLLAQLADADQPIQYRTTRDAQPFSWPAMITRTQFQDDISPHGELRVIETCKATIRRAAMVADGVTSFEKMAIVTLPNGTHWAVREGDSGWGETFVVLGLKRIYLSEMGGQRGTV